MAHDEPNSMMPAMRARRITRTSFIGIGVNLQLASFKAAVGLLSNSVAIILDVLVDFTVRDRAALRDALVAELAPRFSARAIVVNFDTDYSD